MRPLVRPPFLLVADVGHTIEIYSEFTRTGGIYIPFPDASCHRIPIRDLADPALRERLRLVWTDPASLDPALRSARVTREISGKLAELARSLEASGHSLAEVGGFLMSCIFTMFAEDVDLLPKASFSGLIASLRDNHRAERFGFITTNSLRQIFNRRVLETHLDGSRGRSPSTGTGCC